MNLMERKPLPDGTKLVCNSGETFIIRGEPIGAGGYSIVYSAKKEGSASYFAIKECYPADNMYVTSHRFYRENGVVKSLTEQGTKYLEQLALRMNEEKEYSQIIFNYSICVVKMLEQLKVGQIYIGEEVYCGAGGIFFLMDDIRMKSISLPQLLKECEKEPADGYPLRFGGLPDIHTTSMIMSEILSAVYKIHTIKESDCVGFLHGDIQENNIFFQDTDIVQGNIGVACLLDLGSMKKIENDGLTKETDCSELCGTQGYIPPELLFAENRIRLGVQADIYSLGRLFFYMLTGNKYPEKERNRVDYEDNICIISPSQGDKIGCRKSVQLYVNEILSKALAFHPEERYSNVLLMKKDMDHLSEMTAPLKYTLQPNLPGLSTFKGRNQEIKEINELFEKSDGNSPVWLYGVGGMGKTELAIRYGTFLKKEKDIDVYRIVFKKSLLDTIASIQFIGDETDRLDKKERFKHNLEIMSKYFGDALFIIDNLEIGKGGIEKLLKSKAYQELVCQPFRILFTTRYYVDYLGLPSMEVGPLNEGELLEIMQHFYPDNKKKTVLKKLIHEADLHTLTVELIARTLWAEQGRISPEQLLDYFVQNRIKQTEMSSVMSNRNRKYDQKTIYSHIQNLFRLNRLKECDKVTLAHALFLPMDGVNMSLYSGFESEERRASLNDVLIPRGWISKTSEGCLTMHPVLAEICLKELGDYLDLSYFEDFFNRIRKRSDLDMGEDYRSFFGLASYLLIAGNWFKSGCLCSMSGINFLRCRVSSKASEALNYALKYSPQDDLAQQAYIYCYLCYAYALGGKGKKARLYGRRSAKIRQQLQPVDKENLAHSYNNLGMAYETLGNYKKMMFYYQKSLDLKKELKMENDIEYAISCNNVGSAYEANGDIKQAMSYYLDAIRICRQVYGKSHPLLAEFCNNAGECSLKEKNYLKSYNYLMEALDICKKLLPPAHHTLIAVYLNLASLWSEWGLWNKFDKNAGMDEAGRYARGALGRVELSEPKDMLLLARCYFINSYLADKKGHYPLAREYGERALNIWKKILPPNHPQFMYVYHNLYYLYLHMGDEKTALYYRDEEMRIKNTLKS